MGESASADVLDCSNRLRYGYFILAAAVNVCAEVVDNDCSAVLTEFGCRYNADTVTAADAYFTGEQIFLES